MHHTPMQLFDFDWEADTDLDILKGVNLKKKVMLKMFIMVSG